MFHTTPFKTTEERHAASSLSKAERQMMIKTLLYRYPLFKQAEDFIGNFHYPVKGGVHDTGCIGGLLGETRAGKSNVCKYYASQHPLRVDENGEVFPVVYVEASGDMTPTHLAEKLFHATGARSIPNMKTPALITNSLLRLVKAKTELLIIDDAQYLFFDRNKIALGHFFSFVKQIADLNKLNLLLVGEDRVHTYIDSVGTLNGRGGFKRMYLRPYGDTGAEFDHFRLLLDGIDRRLPFKEQSGLNLGHRAQDFWRFSDGMIGRVMNVVRAAAMRAVDADASKILTEHLREEAEMRVGLNDSYRYFSRG